MKRPSDGPDEWASPAVMAAAWRFAVSLVGQNDADDLFQESLSRAWQQRTSFDRNRGSLLTWILTIMRSQHLDQVRKAARRRVIDRVRPDIIEMTLPESRIDVRHAVNQLAPLQRATIILFYYVDLSVAECAFCLDRSIGTIKSTLADARVALAKQLGAPYGKD